MKSPLAVIELMLTTAVWLLVRVTIWVGLTVPTACGANGKLVGDADGYEICADAGNRAG